MKIEFFPTRTAARDAAKLAGVKPIDNGADSAPGKRWSIQMSDCFYHAAEETSRANENWAKSAPGKATAAIILPPATDAAPVVDPVVSVSVDPVPVLHVARHPSGRRFPFSSRSTLAQGSNGRKIPVEWRKRHHMEIHA